MIETLRKSKPYYKNFCANNKKITQNQLNFGHNVMKQEVLMMNWHSPEGITLLSSSLSKLHPKKKKNQKEKDILIPWSV